MVTDDSGEVAGWVERGPGYLQRPLVHAHGSLLSLLKLEPGRRFPGHRHPQAQVGIVLDGGGRTHVDHRVKRLAAGDAYFLPPGLPHSFDTDFGPPTVALDLLVAPKRGRPVSEAALTEALWARVRAGGGAFSVYLGGSPAFTAGSARRGLAGAGEPSRRTREPAPLPR